MQEPCNSTVAAEMAVQVRVCCWQSLAWGVPGHGEGDLSCSSSPSSAHSGPMGFKFWGEAVVALAFPW